MDSIVKLDQQILATENTVVKSFLRSELCELLSQLNWSQLQALRPVLKSTSLPELHVKLDNMHIGICVHRHNSAFTLYVNDSIRLAGLSFCDKEFEHIDNNETDSYTILYLWSDVPGCKYGSTLLLFMAQYCLANNRKYLRLCRLEDDWLEGYYTKRGFKAAPGDPDPKEMIAEAADVYRLCKALL